MKLRIFFIVLFVFSFSGQTYAQDESLTISTYYPAPYGEYEELSTGRFHLEPRDTRPGGPAIGDIYYDNGTTNAEGVYAYTSTGWSQILGTGGGGVIAENTLVHADVGGTFVGGPRVFTITESLELDQKAVVFINSLFGNRCLPLTSGGMGGTITVNGDIYAANSPQGAKEFIDSISCFVVLDAGTHTITLTATGNGAAGGWVLTNCDLRYIAIAY